MHRRWRAALPPQLGRTWLREALEPLALPPIIECTRRLRGQEEADEKPSQLRVAERTKVVGKGGGEQRGDRTALGWLMVGGQQAVGAWKLLVLGGWLAGFGACGWRRGCRSDGDRWRRRGEGDEHEVVEETERHVKEDGDAPIGEDGLASGRNRVQSGGASCCPSLSLSLSLSATSWPRTSTGPQTRSNEPAATSKRQEGKR